MNYTLLSVYFYLQIVFIIIGLYFYSCDLSWHCRRDQYMQYDDYLPAMQTLALILMMIAILNNKTATINNKTFIAFSIAMTALSYAVCIPSKPPLKAFITFVVGGLVQLVWAYWLSIS